MSIQNRSTSFLIAAALIAAMVPLLATTSSLQQNPATVDVKIAGGLQTATFDMPQGKLRLNLPDDMTAGDTITGTVIPEPKGSTEDERNTNRDVLNGYVVQIQGQSFPVDKGVVGPVVIRREQLPKGRPHTEDSFLDVFIVIDPHNHSAAARARIPLLPSGAVIAPDPKATPAFIIPPVGQTGRPIVITGPFDGNSSNTTINAAALPRSSHDSGESGLIAESPRKAVFIAPTGVTGPIELHVTEGKRQTTGTYRNVGVNLSAPKTSLLKGESTTLTIEVSGLQGITEPVPLHLVKGGVVSMEGGDVQTMSIKPAEVKRNGTFTTTRAITGVQAGVWSATATVVIFDVCLRDDNNGNSIILNRETGDYIFCGGAKPMSLSTMDFGGGVSPQTGSGVEVNSKGSIFTLEHNAPDRRVLIHLSGTSGTATVQTTRSKQKFTITDRDLRNSTCACQ
jgi:hypothetical protein